MADLVGLTMRSATAESYREERDAIARDWYGFLRAAVPELRWILLPNLGAELAGYARGLGVTHVILSGGDDPGSAPRRDESELALVADAVARRVPIFGVCRGLQIVQRYFGGEIVTCDRERHVATTHVVRFVAPARATERTVNSFHGLAAAADRLGAGLEVVARAADGEIEAVRHSSLPILAVQWHPERTGAPDAEDVELLRSHFGLGAR